MKKPDLLSAAMKALTAPFVALAQTARPKDAQIAAIVVTANQFDIDAGNFVDSKSTNKEIKAFAQRMVKDHILVDRAAMELMTKLKFKLEENPTSNALKKAGDDTLKRLEGLQGAEFDKAYIDNEVTYHQTVLDAIDKTLIPSAKNEELKALFLKVRPAFVVHLDHAKRLQATLTK